MTPQGAVVAIAGADQQGVVRGTAVTLSGAGSSSTPGTTYTWTQLVTGASTRTEMPDGVDKVALTPSGKNASFTLPFYKYPMVNKPLTFELTVTFGDTVQDRCGRHHAPFGHRGDQRRPSGRPATSGSAARAPDGGIVTVRSANGTVYGTAVVTGGAWELRLRNGASPRPIQEPCSRTPTSEAPQDPFAVTAGVTLHTNTI